MQRTNKTSAPIAAAFFIVSLAIMPFSLKVVGLTLSLNPSMSALVDVWNLVAGSFGNIDQPSASAEMLAISNLVSDEARGSAVDSENGNTLLAALDQPEVEPLYQPRSFVAEVEAVDSNTPQARNLNAASHSNCSVKHVAAGAYYKVIQARIGQKLEALRAAEAAQRAIAANSEALTGLNTQLAALKLDFKQFRSIPFNKGVKVLFRMKPIKPVAPKLTACDLRRALTGGASPEFRQRAARVRLVEESASSFENSEL